MWEDAQIHLLVKGQQGLELLFRVLQIKRVTRSFLSVKVLGYLSRCGQSKNWSDRKIINFEHMRISYSNLVRRLT